MSVTAVRGTPAVRRERPSWQDLLLVGLLTAYALVEMRVSDTRSAKDLPVQVVWAFGTILPVAVRRAAPGPVLILVTAFFASKPLVLHPMPELLAEVLGLAVALYAVGRLLPLRESLKWVVPALALAWFRAKGSPEYGVGGNLVNEMYAVGAWAVGRMVRSLDQRVVRSEHRVATVEDWAAESSREAVADERARIARELHDIVAHNLGVVLLHSGGGRRMLDHDVDRARAAFDTIDAATAEALAEMRRLLHVLRAEPDPIAPQPRLEDLPALAERCRSAGVEVDLDVEPGLTASPGLSLCVYRIVQEATTNAVRHGAATHLSVGVRRSGDGLDLSVLDDGTPQPVSHQGDRHAHGAPGGGHGIAGMRERVRLFGGTLELGPRDEGGFAVRAHLPTGDA